MVPWGGGGGLGGFIGNESGGIVHWGGRGNLGSCIGNESPGIVHWGGLIWAAVFGTRHFPYGSARPVATSTGVNAWAQGGGGA